MVIEPDADTLLITDHHGPLALAGIMGGEISSCTDATRDVFLESAFFSPASIAGRARRYGLQTDSSYRFERGVDPQLQRRAAEPVKRDRSLKRYRLSSYPLNRRFACGPDGCASC